MRAVGLFWEGASLIRALDDSCFECVDPVDRNAELFISHRLADFDVSFRVKRGRPV